MESNSCAKAMLHEKTSKNQALGESLVEKTTGRSRKRQKPRQQHFQPSPIATAAFSPPQSGAIGVTGVKSMAIDFLLGGRRVASRTGATTSDTLRLPKSDPVN
jgi:hypothetical protein